MTYTPTDEEQQIAAFMMARDGLSPRDIATALRVDEQQVRQWLSHKKVEETEQ